MSESELSDPVATDLTMLRNRLRVVDDIDRSTTTMVERLAEVVRASAEARAQATLEIAAAIDRLERTVRERDAARRDALTLLQQDVSLAHARAVGVGLALTGLESELATLHGRLSLPDDSTEAPSTPTAEAVEAELTPTQQPLPSATSLYVEIEQVPSAGAALSIQRFVSELPGVVAATTREYAAGLLRLEVRVRGALEPEALLNWPGGSLELSAQDDDALLYRLVDR